MRRLGSVGLAVASASLLVSCTGSSSAPTPGHVTSAPAGAAVITEFAAAWPQHGAARFHNLADSPTNAARAIARYDADLGATDTTVTLIGAPGCGSTRCSQAATVSLALAGAGVWRYSTRITSEQRHGTWLVRWAPATFHPGLTDATRLVENRSLPPRAPLLDRNGQALTPERPIERIGVVPRRVRSDTYRRLSPLVPLDVAALRQRVAAAQPDWFVPVIDLRRADYRPLRSRLLRVPGIAVDPARRALAPTASWGRAVLGSVGPATSDALKGAGPYALPTDEVGLSGLQLAYQQRLAGVPGISVDLAAKRSPHRVIKRLFSRQPKAGEPLATSLDAAAQSSAERAVADASSLTSLVAVKASTGEVLAAANAPGPTSYNSAFVGRYAPGSTFKVVTAAALLSNSVASAKSPVTCPDSRAINGKVFSNYATGILPGRATLADAFAASCNTAFIGFVHRLSGAQLTTAARQFGLEASWRLGLDAFSGSVPVDHDVVTRAADMIGQGRVEASPLAMAMVAATADSGAARTPTLLPDVAPGSRLDRVRHAVISQLQKMMRLTVTAGTAAVLDVPGLPIYAKTGTAEYQSGRSTGTNAWLIGYRGDVAFAVLVTNGTSGGHDAAPVVASFLNGLPDRLYR